MFLFQKWMKIVSINHPIMDDYYTLLNNHPHLDDNYFFSLERLMSSIIIYFWIFKKVDEFMLTILIHFWILTKPGKSVASSPDSPLKS